MSSTSVTLKDFFSDEQLKKLGKKRNNNKKDKKNERPINTK
jgi:hypothetical protein